MITLLNPNTIIVNGLKLTDDEIINAFIERELLKEDLENISKSNTEEL